jgi:hypothetical protein
MVLMIARSTSCRTGIDATVEEDTRLKEARHGGAWWHRFFTRALATDAAYVFKVDPDTCVARKLTVFPHADVFGTLIDAGADSEHVQGGFQGFRRAFVKRVVDSQCALDPELTDRASWVFNAAHHRVVESFGDDYLSTDAVLMALVRKLGATIAAHPQVNSTWRSRAGNTREEGWAVTHPHKNAVLELKEKRRPVEVVVMNWRRPMNVERIAEAFARQGDLCSLTLIDAATDSPWQLSPNATAAADRVFRFSDNWGSSNRFIPLTSYKSQYTYFHDDDMLPGDRVISYLLDCAARRPEISVLGQFGRMVNMRGQEMLHDVPAAEGRMTTVDFLVRGYFVLSANLLHFVEQTRRLGIDMEGCEDDILLSAMLQLKDGNRCRITPNCGSECRMCAVPLEEPHALKARPDHLIRRAGRSEG